MSHLQERVYDDICKKLKNLSDRRKRVLPLPLMQNPKRWKYCAECMVWKTYYQDGDNSNMLPKHQTSKRWCPLPTQQWTAVTYWSYRQRLLHSRAKGCSISQQEKSVDAEMSAGNVSSTLLPGLDDGEIQHLLLHIENQIWCKILVFINLDHRRQMDQCRWNGWTT